MNKTTDMENNSSLRTPQLSYNNMEPGTKHVILSISLVIIQIFGIFGNTMLILVVYRKPHLRTCTNMFILNLACADLGVALLCMPFSVVTCARQSWVFGAAFCQFNGFINIMFAMCSLLTLTAISIEKYFTIVKPLDRVITRQRALLMLAVTWLEPVLFASLPLTGFTRYEYKEGNTQCSVQTPVSLGQTIHGGLVFLVAYVIPLSIMVFAYVKIFKAAQVHNRRMSHTSMTTGVARTSMSSQNQIALTIFIMLIVFIICWTPYFVYVVYITASHVTDDQTRDLGLAAYWCVFLNSALNPFIYGFRNPNFKIAFSEILQSTTCAICNLFGNVKKRGYSSSSTSVTKPSSQVLVLGPDVALGCFVPSNNSEVTPEVSCHSNESCHTENEPRMSNVHTCKWEKGNGKVEAVVGERELHFSEEMCKNKFSRSENFGRAQEAPNFLQERTLTSLEESIRQDHLLRTEENIHNSILFFKNIVSCIPQFYRATESNSISNTSCGENSYFASRIEGSFERELSLYSCKNSEKCDTTNAFSLTREKKNGENCMSKPQLSDNGSSHGELADQRQASKDLDNQLHHLKAKNHLASYTNQSFEGREEDLSGTQSLHCRNNCNECLPDIKKMSLTFHQPCKIWC